jgi:hypothetical protein
MATLIFGFSVSANEPGWKLTGVGGVGIDVDWETQVSGKLYGGFQLSHRNLKYAEAGDSSADNQLRSELSPRLNLGILF